MKAGQICTFRKKYVGTWYGKLQVIADIGNRVYKHKNGKLTTPLLKLTCKLGHTEERTIISLRSTGDNTQCRTCRRLKHSTE